MATQSQLESLARDCLELAARMKEAGFRDYAALLKGLAEYVRKL